MTIKGFPEVSVGGTKVDIEPMSLVSQRKNSLDYYRVETLEPNQLNYLVNQNYYLDQDITPVKQPDSPSKKRRVHLQI